MKLVLTRHERKAWNLTYKYLLPPSQLARPARLIGGVRSADPLSTQCFECQLDIETSARSIQFEIDDCLNTPPGRQIAKDRPIVAIKRARASLTEDDT
jgi:hypothetical protein